MSTGEYLPVVYVPDTLLGLRFHTWTTTNILLVLDHYNWNYGATTTKIDLMHELDLLVQEYDLDRKDRAEILNAYRSNGPTPRRKPRVRRVPRPTPVWEAKDLRSMAFNKTQARTRSQFAVEAATAAIPLAHNTAVAISPAPNVVNVLSEECVVCFETLSPQNTPKRKVTSLCNHEPDVCNSCLAMSISTQFNSKVWDQIDCPTCGQRLGFQDVKTFADSVVFERSEPTYQVNQRGPNLLKQIRQSFATSMPFRRSIPALSPSQLPIWPAVLS